MHVNNFFCLAVKKVVVEFIKTFATHENENLLEEQLFKCAVAVDAIYGARHRKYVSAINLAASAIKYSIAKSKTIIDLDSRFLSSGGYRKFIKWQENLAGEGYTTSKRFTNFSL